MPVQQMIEVMKLMNGVLIVSLWIRHGKLKRRLHPVPLLPQLLALLAQRDWNWIVVIQGRGRRLFPATNSQMPGMMLLMIPSGSLTGGSRSGLVLTKYLTSATKTRRRMSGLTIGGSGREPERDGRKTFRMMKCAPHEGVIGLLGMRIHGRAEKCGFGHQGFLRGSVFSISADLIY